MLPEPAEDGTLEIVAPDNDAADDGEKTAPVARLRPAIRCGSTSARSATGLC
jgi:hypothetical protein